MHFALSVGTPNKTSHPLFPWHCLEEEKAKLDPAYHLKSTNMETRETLAELYRDYKGDQLLASTSKEPEVKKTDKLNAVSEHTITLMKLQHFINLKQCTLSSLETLTLCHLSDF